MNITSKSIDGVIKIYIDNVEIGDVASVVKDFVIIHGDCIKWKIKYKLIS